MALRPYSRSWYTPSFNRKPLAVHLLPCTQSLQPPQLTAKQHSPVLQPRIHRNPRQTHCFNPLLSS